MSATRATPATFLRGAHQIVSAETAAAHHPDPAAVDRPELRGDPVSPEVVRIVALIRPESVDRGPWGDLA